MSVKQLTFLVIWCSVTINVFGQSPDFSPKYVDIHNHVTLKNYLRAVEHADSLLKHPERYQYENWYNVNNSFNINDKSHEDNFYQADFSLLAGARFKIICNSVTPIEIQSYSTRVDRYANSNFETHVAPEKLINLSRSTPFKEFLADTKFLEAQKNIVFDSLNPTKFKLVKNKEELIECVNNKTVAIINTVEGGHVLYGERIKKDQYFAVPDCDEACQEEIIKNTIAIKNMPQRVLFFGICHLFANKLAGHAKALDVGANTKFNKLVMRKALVLITKIPFLKTLLDAKHFEGLAAGKVNVYDPENHHKIKRVMDSDIGKKVIEILLDTTIGPHKKPILIDIKHMDVQSRLDYYKFLDADSSRKNIPIICSHAAASGKNQKIAAITGSFPFYDAFAENRNPFGFYHRKWGEWTQQFNLTTSDQPNEIGWLNPFSINLYDEEIKRINDSKGLIGLILEQRSLGGYMINYSDERAEQLLDTLQKKHQLSALDAQLYLDTEPFLRNLFYFVQKSGRTDISAWNALSLGSDFDGFIDPINSCPNAAFMPTFEKLLVKFIPIYLEREHKNQALLYGMTPQKAVDKLLFENAEKFIFTHF